MLSQKIIEKYNVSSPRYTSYPTILDWNQETLDGAVFETRLKSYLSSLAHLKSSVYVHLPFCESLCTFCGCHKHITKNHSVEEPYIDALLKEWNKYVSLTNDKKIAVEELHLGGGTPTFFSIQALDRLLAELTKNRPKKVYYSVEGHPNNTTEEHLKLFRNYGFERISFGVQDYSPEVQQAINRIQSFEQVKKVTDQARKLGYKSISHDLVFGLPKQTKEGFENSILKTIQLKPDAISLYSYAHVPWVKGTGQRGFDESDLPSGIEKRAIYELAKTILINEGYEEIGMDHFGLKHEPLTKAKQQKSLNRNFMGYTAAKAENLIGLGVSAISEYPFGYAQNKKTVKEYHEAINNSLFPVFKGHFHSEQDLEMKHHIKNLMCQFETEYQDSLYLTKILESKAIKIKQLINDKIIKVSSNKITVTEDGQPFVRNVCMTIDPYIKDHEMEKKFSKSV